MKKLFLASSFAMLIGTAHAQGITWMNSREQI